MFLSKKRGFFARPIKSSEIISVPTALQHARNATGFSFSSASDVVQLLCFVSFMTISLEHVNDILVALPTTNSPVKCLALDTQLTVEPV